MSGWQKRNYLHSSDKIALVLYQKSVTGMSIKPLLLFTAICCYCLLLTACSIGIDFVIVNRSSAPIQIVLETKGKIESYVETQELCKQPLTDSKYKHDAWNIVASGDYPIDATINQITITLNPQEALKVESITNYDESSPSASQQFRLKSIKITGANGEVSHTGEQARIQFMKAAQGHREISYQ